MSFINDYSKYGVVYHLQRKSQVFESFLHFTWQAERETGNKLVDLRSDNGGEYISKQMPDWCHKHGIKQTMGPPHTPELNGIAERYNRTLLDRLKPSLHHSSLHQEYWSDALDYAVWTTNRSPTRTNDGFKTPYEIYEGRLPSMRHAHIFGAEGVYLVPSANRQKLDNHSRSCLFLGVLPHGDGVKVLDKSTRQIAKTQDAVFDENHESLDTTPYSQPPSSTPPVNPPWIYPDKHNQDCEPNIINESCPRQQRQPPTRYGTLHAHSATTENSPTYKLAMHSADRVSWKSAMKLEINNFIERKVFTLVPRPTNWKIISCRWHLKKKPNLDGLLKKIKARLVAC